MDSLVSIRRKVRGSAESIWRALTEPLGLAAWQADRVEGVVELGGHLLLSWPALGAEVDLDVVECVPEKRLVLATSGSEVCFEIAGSLVTLTHSGLEPGDEAEGTHASWLVALGTLDHYLAHHAGRPRRTAWAVERARTTAGVAHAYYTDEAALSAWLTRAGGIGDAGSDVRLQLGWGALLTGRVVASVPGRDLAITWQEAGESLLVFRTLPAPFSESERLLVATWSCWGSEPDARTHDEIGKALRRLARVFSHVGEA